MRVGHTAAVIAALLGATMPARATEARLGGVTVDLPEDGWQRSDKGGILLNKALPVDRAAGRDEKAAAILSVLPAVTSGSFEQNFAAAAGLVPELRAEKPLTHSAGTTANGYPIRVEHRCCDRRGPIMLSSTAVGIQGPGVQQFVVLVGLNLRGDDSKAMEATLAALVRSIRLSPTDRPFDLVPPSGAGGLDGVWSTLRTNLMPNAFGGLDFQADNEVLRLDPSGLYSRELAAGTVAEHCRAVPTDCGTYRLVGGGWFSKPSRIETREVQNAYGVIETKTQDFARAGDHLTIDKQDYRPVPGLPAGAHLEGTWRYQYASSGSMAGSSGGVSVERTLTLHADGTFERTGSTGFMSTTDTGGGTTGVAGTTRRPPSEGRYEAEGYGLTLIGGDGQRQTLSLFRPDAEGDADGLLVIDGDNYLKQKP